MLLFSIFAIDKQYEERIGTAVLTPKNGKRFMYENVFHKDVACGGGSPQCYFGIVFR